MGNQEMSKKVGRIGFELSQNQKLTPDQFLSSHLEEHKLTLTREGILSIYAKRNDEKYEQIWSNKDAIKKTNQKARELIMQKDGNLVIYATDDSVIWASNTGEKGQGPYHLSMQEDQNLVIYAKNHVAIWASGTYRKQKNPTTKNRGNTLYGQQWLTTGQYLINAKGVTAILQEDGNFVMYKHQKPLWNTATHGKNGVKLIMQTDGNLVLYDAKGMTVWTSGSYGKGQQPYSLVLQDDQNLVAYGKGKVPIWASNTYSAN